MTCLTIRTVAWVAMTLARDAARLLSEVAEPESAPAMAAYLKTDMPFYGVKSAPRKAILRTLKSEYPVETNDGYRSDVLSLWSLPHREEKYLALGWASAHRQFITTDNLDLYERLLSTGAGGISWTT